MRTCWANQDKAKALALFEGCSGANYGPFYLSRASLKEGESRLTDLLKTEQVDESWRTGLALINYYIGLKYAKALCETSQYQPCISLLSKIQVLPNEGSYAGRAVYREANLYRAMEQLRSKNYKQVMKSVEASKEWPETC